MADPPPHVANGNGHTTIIGAGAKLGSQMINLAPQFLALILINVLFLGSLYWFVDARARHTSELIQKLLESCLQR